MRALIYARVFTEEQVDGFSIAAQLSAFQEFCQSKGWRIVAEFVEEGRSAKSEDIRQRPEFVKALGTGWEA